MDIPLIASTDWFLGGAVPGGGEVLQQGAAAARRMIAPGLLGFYTHVEVTEVVAFVGRNLPPINVFTLLVAEGRVEQPPVTPHFLNTTRITLQGLRDWRFGICRYLLPVDDAVAALEALEQQGRWDASGNPLALGPVVARSTQFVPPDQRDNVPINGVLKNNFWNGAHVIEWADLAKQRLRPFFDDPRLLQNLSDAVREWLPLRFASLSDRIGNVVLQLPVTVLMASFEGAREGVFQVNLAWHPNAKPRPLRVTVDVEFDSALSGHFTREVSEGVTSLPVLTHPGMYRAYLWDSDEELLLAATGRAGFISSADLNIRVIESEPRMFRVKADDGSMAEQRIVVQRSMQSIISRPDVVSKSDWTSKRMYREETSRLVRERQFIQYRPALGAKQSEHQKALSDIRHLVAQYGAEGAWLWDPYLSAEDILKTLFFCPYAGADLRGLTAMKEPQDGGPSMATDVYFKHQRQTFADAEGNGYGLRLEYRAKSGMAGWAFHDRFLIFPRAEQASLAWSLGTSINCLGKAHHILQRVDDGQQVRDAFVDLWDRLNAPEHLIWKAGAP